MQHKHTFSFFQSFFALLICCFFFQSTVYAQGWRLSYYISASTETNTRNDIISIPDYTANDSDSITYPVGLFPYESFHRLNFANITNEQSPGFSSGPQVPDTLDHLDLFPIRAVMPHSDSVIVLMNRQGSDLQDILLGKFYVLDDWVTPNKIDWVTTAFDQPQQIMTGTALQITSDHHLIAMAHSPITMVGDSLVNNIQLAKFDTDGQPLWSNTLTSMTNDKGVQIINAAEGGFWVLKNTQADVLSPTTETRIVKIDDAGDLEWEATVGNANDTALDMTLTQDGLLAITGYNDDTKLYVLVVDPSAMPVWRQDYDTPGKSLTGRSIAEDQQQHLIVVGEQLTENGGDKNAFMAKLSKNGTPLWERYYGATDQAEDFNDVVITPSGQYLMGGYREIISGEDSFFSALLTKTDTFGITKSGVVMGNVFHDLNLNCISDSSEQGLSGWNIQVSSDTLNYYGHTDIQGNYWIPVDIEVGDTIDFTVTVVPPSSYWQACANDIVVSLHYLDTTSVLFPMQPVIECPFPEAEVAATRYRPCEISTIFIDYCNRGTAIAEDATVEVTLDHLLSYESASIPPSSIDGQVLTFPLGDIGINECGELTINVQVSCDSIESGDVICVDAYMTPDTICESPGQGWSGALLQVSYECQDDELFFNIENIGTEGMETAQEYIIIEDAVLLMQSEFNLEPVENKQSQALPINGSTYHLIAPQEPGAPGAAWLSLGANACPNNNSSIFNEFPQNTGALFSNNYCQIVVGSFGPNDQLAYPSGFGEENYILPNMDIQHTIHFQNTGADTAFRVIIRDTITQLLDPASIVPGPSSHPYNFRMESDGILIFNFYDIELPDSTTNLAASQGFVSFSIAQQRDLEEGTVIENSAGIYFDFNDPIITNTTFHTIAELITIVNESVSVASPELTVKVSPNPMQNGAWISIGHLSNANQPLQLQLYDMTGKLVRTEHGQSNQVWLDRDHLAAGMYFFTIAQAGEWLANGKLVVK
jgi:hypothetical protein